MSLNAALQLQVVEAHLLSLAVLIGIAANFSSRRWASALSLVAITTSGVVTLGLAGLLLMLAEAGAGTGGFSPIAFAGGFPAGLVAYLLVFVFAWVLRPRPLQFSAAVWCIALLGFSKFNSIFLALPTVAGTTVTVYVQTADSKPISGATPHTNQNSAKAPLRRYPIPMAELLCTRNSATQLTESSLHQLSTPK